MKPEITITISLPLQGAQILMEPTVSAQPQPEPLPLPPSFSADEGVVAEDHIPLPPETA